MDINVRGTCLISENRKNLYPRSILAIIMVLGKKGRTCIVELRRDSNFGPSILGTLEMVSISNRPTVPSPGIVPACVCVCVCGGGGVRD